LLDWDLDILNCSLDLTAEETDELTARFVRPVSVVSHLNLDVNSLRSSTNNHICWQLDDLSSVDFVSTDSFPCRVIVRPILRWMVQISSPLSTWSTIAVFSPATTATVLRLSLAPSFHLFTPSLPSLLIIDLVDGHGWRLVPLFGYLWTHGLLQS